MDRTITGKQRPGFEHDSRPENRPASQDIRNAHPLGPAKPIQSPKRRNASADERLEEIALGAAEEERRRLGHELHDSIQQELAALRMIASLLAERLKKFQPRGLPAADEAVLLDIRRRSERIADAAGEVLQNLQSLARGVIPQEIAADALGARLGDLTGQLGAAGIDASFHCEGPAAAMDAFTATHLHRIAKEAVANALKHSGATRIEISLSATEDQLQLRIRDNGAGLRPERGAETGRAFRSIRYRAGQIGASLDIGNGHGGGCKVACVLPLR